LLHFLAQFFIPQKPEVFEKEPQLFAFVGIHEDNAWKSPTTERERERTVRERPETLELGGRMVFLICVGKEIKRDVKRC